MTAIRWGLALLAWFSCAWFGSWELNPNNATRLFAAIAIVEHDSAEIDPFAALTIDKARFGDHFYLDKAPGMTLIALPAVALADAMTGTRAHPDGTDTFARYLRLRLRLAVAMGTAVLTAAAAVALFELALGVSGSAAAALFASLGYVLGTPIWGWSTTIFGHAAVAALFVIALWAMWRAERTGHALVAGLALGWAVVIEYQAVLAGGVLAAYALWRWRGRWRLVAAAALGGAIGLAPLVGYNEFAFGVPFRLGYAGVVGFEGMQQGFFGLTAPSPRALWEILFGTRRGLLWVAPVLVIAVRGMAYLIAMRRARAIGLAAAGAALVVLMTNAAYVYWDGGNSTGPRHAMPAMGLLALGLAPLWATLTARGRRWAAALLGASIAVNLMIAGCDVFAASWDGSQLHWVVTQRLVEGDVTSLANNYAGLPPWTGLAIWAAVALPAIAWLARLARLQDAGPRIRIFGSA